MGAVESVGKFELLLKDKSLLKQAAFIDGKWVKAKSGQDFSVTNPATGEEIARVPNLSRDDALEAGGVLLRPLAGRGRDLGLGGFRLFDAAFDALGRAPDEVRHLQSVTPDQSILGWLSAGNVWLESQSNEVPISNRAWLDAPDEAKPPRPETADHTRSERRTEVAACE